MPATPVTRFQQTRIIFHGLRCAFLLLAFPLKSMGSPESTAPVIGLKDNTPQVHALIGATVITEPGVIVRNGTVLIRDGLIQGVGVDLEIPPDARIWDMQSKWIFPGFIESRTHIGIAEDKKPADGNNAPEENNKRTGSHSWNSLITPERQLATRLDLKTKELEELRKLGFTSALVTPGKGIMGGQSVFINLNSTVANECILKSNVKQHVAFEFGSRGKRPAQYPVSLMGCIALIRQTLYDAQWYSHTFEKSKNKPDSQKRSEHNHSLLALSNVITNQQSIAFSASDELDYLRIQKIAEEFHLSNFHIEGNGYEYRKLNLLKSLNIPLIVPLNFPDTPAVENPDSAIEIPLEQLQHWELAPANPAFLAKKQIAFCITSSSLEKPGKSFWKNLRKSIRFGLSESNALAALTTNPARMIGEQDRIGDIKNGKIANLVIASGNLFSDDKAKILNVWIDGKKIKNKNVEPPEINGDWTISWNGILGTNSWTISGAPNKLQIKADNKKFPGKLNGNNLLIFPEASLFNLESGTIRLTGLIENDTITGSGTLPTGRTFSWTAIRNKETAKTNEDQTTKEDTSEKEEEKKNDEAPPPLEFNHYPAGAYGVKPIKANSKSIVIKNATIWTCSDQGILKNADLLIENTKIIAIGRDITIPDDAIVIDGMGKHLTPGIIDCHSHTAIVGGVNEGTHAVTVEVRIGDVVNPTDIALYRELAGGLTTANLLHGSANPMGGQNQVIKLRWGENAEGLKFKDAKPGVKFALGENVKQSNWGDDYRTRYPQTRMGVEQIMRDTFMAAKRYEKENAAYKAESNAIPPRRNLRLEAVLEILNRQRIVHIHSYRQDEILMFVRLAEEFGFKVGTFQHVLEGYKVADAIAKINAGGSSFSDWWAYKFEVYDAIPYNGALLHENGVVTSFNSDNNHLATRLNLEAAKAIKYGNLPEEEALRFVTLNPAIQLEIDDRVGSLETGKDADFVIWSDHPLSVYTHAEQTWIDGRKYFDHEEDRKAKEGINKERQRLIAKALKERVRNLTSDAKKDQNNTDKKPAGKRSIFDYYRRKHNETYGSGHGQDQCNCGVIFPNQQR